MNSQPRTDSKQRTRPRALPIALGCCAVLLLLAPQSANATTTLYLRSDGVPAASLTTAAPGTRTLANHDPLRDGLPGLLLEKGGSGWSETDPAKYQQWVGPATGTTLAGPTRLLFWAAMRNFGTASRGVVEAFLMDCEANGSNCSLIAQADKDILDWSGGWGSWTMNSIEFGDLRYTVAAGRSLSVKLIVGADADDDMWLAYDSADYPSRLSDDARSDIVIDGDFSDWSNLSGTELVIDDQAGPKDWGSPARLDLTRFAVSSNLIDTFHLLIAFDEVQPQGTTAATLLDTDFDNNVNFALVATLDGPAVSLELYSCDDSVTFGCNGAVRMRSYPGDFFRTGVAPGPWDDDIVLEAALPFHELGFRGGVVVFTSLASYASASLLTSPKDSILGVGEQDYAAGIQFNTTTTKGSLIQSLGSDYLIRRHTDPSLVRTAVDHASVVTSPFDDLPGTLDDGASYYYVIEQAGGLPVNLSAHANPYAGSIRLGFDDQNALSAPTDPVLSTVQTNTTSIPADGTASATVTVVPRDAQGIPLGAGCALEVDPIRLAPGVLGGPVQDNLDGSYTLRVVSTTVGSGSVVVSVEGIEAANQPQIEFTTF